MDKTAYLKENGINVDEALNYMGDFETFNEILVDFYNGIDSQFAELEGFKNAGDLPNYAIAVHALKSNCRSLGVTSFAETAYNHEMESKAGNMAYVNDNFINLQQAKDNFKNVISKYLSL